jgi:4-alpha-glucanotransferase
VSEHVLLAERLAARGVGRPYVDSYDEMRSTTTETLRLLEPHFPEGDGARRALVCTPGEPHGELYGTLLLEDGETLAVDGVAPSHAGYHTLITPEGEHRPVLAAPPRLLQPRRGCGVAVQLYAARSDASWGVGDYADLAVIARLAKARGAASVLVSPLHAQNPLAHQEDSPYAPSSRLWLNLQHLSIPSLPEAALVDLSDLDAAGRALNSQRLVDRDASFALKLEALERIWVAQGRRPGEEARWWIAAQGEDLRSFALFSVLCEQQGSGWWQSWPAPLRRRDTQETKLVEVTNLERIGFWSWCQFLADRQLAEACAQGVDVICDLAVGFSADGADAWRYQDLAVFDCEVGCPPGRQNREGQGWGLPPFHPHRLADAGFEPFKQMLRRGMRHCQALRMDHVMQLWRLYWVPLGVSRADGCYVDNHSDQLLAIMLIEAERAGAWVVGEDMGVVDAQAREAMDRIGMLGYRVSGRTDPADSPECSMTACETHDQPTLAGLATCSDRDDQLRIGKQFDPALMERLHDELLARAGVDPLREPSAADVEAAIVAEYARVAASPSRLVLATTDDLASVAERPNMPNVVSDYPNWRIALPVTIDELFASPLAERIFATFARDGRSGELRPAA